VKYPGHLFGFKQNKNPGDVANARVVLSNDKTAACGSLAVWGVV